MTFSFRKSVLAASVSLTALLAAQAAQAAQAASAQEAVFVMASNEVGAPTYNPITATMLGADGIRVKDGQPLKVTLWTQSDSIFRRPSEVIQAQLKAVGIAAEITTFDSSMIRDQYKTGEQQLAVRSYNWDNADIVDWFFGGDRLGYPNVSMFNDPKAEELRAAAMTGAKNMQERAANFTAYHEYVLSQFPMAPIYQPVQAIAYNKDHLTLPEKIDSPAFGASFFTDIAAAE